MSPTAGPFEGTNVPAQPPRAYEQLAAKIRQRVETGVLKIGDRLPSEIALAQEEQVGRSTVREAIRQLEEAGVLERRSPKILVVKSTGEDIALEEFNRALERRSVRFLDVYDAQLVLEPALARFAAERATPDGLAALRSALDHQDAATAQDAKVWHDASRRFRRELAEMARNPALFIARASLSFLLQPALRAIYTTTADARHLYLLNAAICEEVAEGDAEGAGYAARKSVLDFGRCWQAAGNGMEDMITRVSLESLAYGSRWDDEP